MSLKFKQISELLKIKIVYKIINIVILTEIIKVDKSKKK